MPSKDFYKVLSLTVFNSLFVFIELAFAIILNSLILLTDSIHNFTDVFTLFISLYALYHSSKSSFTSARAGIISALCTTIFLLGTMFLLAIESIHRFIEPIVIENPLLIVWISIAGFAVNFLGIILFSNHGHSHSHNHSHHLNLKSIFIHFLGDALTSLGAAITGLLVYFIDHSWKYYFDPAITLLIVVIMVLTSKGVIKESISILMQKPPEALNVEKLKEDLENIVGVIKVHDLHIWTLSENKYIGSVHVLCFSSDVNDIIGLMKKEFHRHNVHSSTIQIEFITEEELENQKWSCRFYCEEECDSKNTCCNPKNETFEYQNLRKRNVEITIS